MTLTRYNNHLITIGFLAIAIACYAIGMVLPAVLFLVIGGAAELTFWVRVLRRRR